MLSWASASLSGKGQRQFLVIIFLIDCGVEELRARQAL